MEDEYEETLRFSPEPTDEGSSFTQGLSGKRGGFLLEGEEDEEEVEELINEDELDAAEADDQEETHTEEAVIDKPEKKPFKPASSGRGGIARGRGMSQRLRGSRVVRGGVNKRGILSRLGPGDALRLRERGRINQNGHNVWDRMGGSPDLRVDLARRKTFADAFPQDIGQPPWSDPVEQEYQRYLHEQRGPRPLFDDPRRYEDDRRQEWHAEGPYDGPPRAREDRWVGQWGPDDHRGMPRGPYDDPRAPQDISPYDDRQHPRELFDGRLGPRNRGPRPLMEEFNAPQGGPMDPRYDDHRHFEELQGRGPPFNGSDRFADRLGPHYDDRRPPDGPDRFADRHGPAGYDDRRPPFDGPDRFADRLGPQYDNRYQYDGPVGYEGRGPQGPERFGDRLGPPFNGPDRFADRLGPQFNDRIPYDGPQAFEGRQFDNHERLGNPQQFDDRPPYDGPVPFDGRGPSGRMSERLGPQFNNRMPLDMVDERGPLPGLMDNRVPPRGMMDNRRDHFLDDRSPLFEGERRPPGGPRGPDRQPVGPRGYDGPPQGGQLSYESQHFFGLRHKDGPPPGPGRNDRDRGPPVRRRDPPKPAMKEAAPDATPAQAEPPAVTTHPNPDFQVAVIHKYSTKKFDADEATQIRSMLLADIMKVAEANIQDPSSQPQLKFQKSGLNEDGIYSISAEDEMTFSWLLKWKPSPLKCDKTNKVYILRVVRMRAMKNSHKIGILIDKSIGFDDLIDNLIERYHSSQIPFSDWRVVSQTFQSGNRYFIFAVDDYTINLLEKMKWSLNFDNTKIVVHLLK